MASFMNKALAYLGLKDVDDDYYADDYEFAEEPTTVHRDARTVYPDRELAEVTEHQRAVQGSVRPFVSDEGREVPVPNGRAAVVRPLIRDRSVNAKVHVVAPERFSDAQEIGDLVKEANPVIVNLQTSDRDLARRMIDFCSGLTYALGGSMEKVADQVFLLTPSNVEVSAEERMRLQERGLFHS